MGERLFLPADYRENPPVSSDALGDLYWKADPSRLELSRQEPVYRLARTIAERRRPRTIVDVGCGTGFKLVRFLGSSASQVVGVDQGSGIQIAERCYPEHQWRRFDIETESHGWGEIRAMRPDLMICVDVIEHLVSPVALLTNLRKALPETGLLLLSTPDRTRLEGASDLGPPKNRKHIREWSEGEMSQLLSSCGLMVAACRHLLPRRYFLAPGELRRVLGRARRGMAIPDRRSCVVFTCGVQAAPHAAESDGASIPEQAADPA